MKPHSEGQHWTAIPRSSPGTYAGADEMQLGRHEDHKRATLLSEPGK